MISGSSGRTSSTCMMWRCAPRLSSAWGWNVSIPSASWALILPSGSSPIWPPFTLGLFIHDDGSLFSIMMRLWFTFTQRFCRGDLHHQFGRGVSTLRSEWAGRHHRGRGPQTTGENPFDQGPDSHSEGDRPVHRKTARRRSHHRQLTYVAAAHTCPNIRFSSI